MTVSKEINSLTKGFQKFLKTLVASSTTSVKTKKGTKAKAKVVKVKAKRTKKVAGEVGGPGRPSGGLKEKLVDIIKDGPMTEQDIAKKLLSDKEKYGWNENESTLYQTLRKCVKEKLLVEGDDRDRKTKTYQVA
jgi:hypothetical protein